MPVLQTPAGAPGAGPEQQALLPPLLERRAASWRGRGGTTARRPARPSARARPAAAFWGGPKYVEFFRVLPDTAQHRGAESPHRPKVSSSLLIVPVKRSARPALVWRTSKQAARDERHRGSSRQLTPPDIYDPGQPPRPVHDAASTARAAPPPFPRTRETQPRTPLPFRKTAAREKTKTARCCAQAPTRRSLTKPLASRPGRSHEATARPQNGARRETAGGVRGPGCGPAPATSPGRGRARHANAAAVGARPAPPRSGRGRAKPARSSSSRQRLRKSAAATSAPTADARPQAPERQAPPPRDAPPAGSQRAGVGQRHNAQAQKKGPQAPQPEARLRFVAHNPVGPLCLHSRALFPEADAWRARFWCSCKQASGVEAARQQRHGLHAPLLPCPPCVARARVLPIGIGPVIPTVGLASRRDGVAQRGQERARRRVRDFVRAPRLPKVSPRLDPRLRAPPRGCTPLPVATHPPCAGLAVAERLEVLDGVRLVVPPRFERPAPRRDPARVPRGRSEPYPTTEGRPQEAAAQRRRTPPPGRDAVAKTGSGSGRACLLPR